MWAARLSLTNVVIADNYAVLGNGVYLYGSPLDALHATVARNSGGQGFDFAPNGADAPFCLRALRARLTICCYNTLALNDIDL